MPFEDIQAKIESVRQELNAENQRGALKDSSKVAELEGQLNNLINQLTPVAEKVEEGNYFLDRVDYDGLKIKNLFFYQSEEESKAAYELVRDIVQNEITKIEHQKHYRVAALESELLASKAEVETAQVNYDKLYEEYTQKRGEINTLQLNFEDMTRKRDASANEVEEAKVEITRLNGHLDDLRKQIAVGASNIDQVVDVSASLENYKQAIRDAEQAKPVIYNVIDLDSSKKRFGANFAANDEYFEDFHMYLKGRYREVTADEAPSFRREESQHTDADNLGDIVEEATELTPPTFQGEEDSTISGVDEVNADLEVATKTVEERLQDLEAGQNVINSVLSALANRTGGPVNVSEMTTKDVA